MIVPLLPPPPPPPIDYVPRDEIWEILILMFISVLVFRPEGQI